MPALIPDALPPELRRPNLRRVEAARYLELRHGVRVAVATLAKLAVLGGGPGFHKMGRVPLYPAEELDRWAAERLGSLVRSTSEVAAQPGRTGGAG